ncbi:MAG TPA: carboxy terminal-processing peptidase [Pseudomonadales bacterium]
MTHGTRNKFPGMVAGTFRTRLRAGIAGAALAFGGLVLSFPLNAQAPLYLPDEIPLDVATIYQELEPQTDYARTTRAIIEQLRRNHYSEIRFDDAFSGKMLDSFIETLDGGRMYFTEADIAEFEQYRATLDDLLQRGDTDAGYLMYNRYQQRVIERLVFTIAMIEDPTTEFDFTVDEEMILDRSEEPWPVDHAALEDIWRQQVKSSVLSLKLTNKTIPEVRELLSKRFRSQLSQVLKTNGSDVYQRYMDAMTMTFDPHTQYYMPRAAENFNMSMRLSLQGIGAVLTTEDEYTKVVEIVSGGPADLGGELHPADRIVGVAQGDNEFVDVIGWRVDDVVEQVRGDKGTVVRLKVIPDGSPGLETKEISITRDTVKLEDSSAQSEIVEVQGEDGMMHRIGVIELPTFYIDFEALQRNEANYRSSTRDVRDLLVKLEDEGVEGVVIDLRRNGGGSLSEANSLVGLFIPRGPTVQVRDADGNNIQQGDPDGQVTYDGPLAVLVNRLSASASEIFAGAIQDHNRGIVLGSQTFGKGTVQELIPLNDGQMKITRAKFYRISGESTQHKGVTPDIVFPDLYDVSDEIGESALPTALPWDTIEPSYYRAYASFEPLLPELVRRHDERLSTDPDFVYIRAQIAKAIEQRDDNRITLNEEKLLAERAADDAWRLDTENARRVAKGLEPLASVDDLDEGSDLAGGDELSNPNDANLDEPAPVDTEEDEEEEEDPYLVESGRILLDLIGLRGNGVSLASQPR